MAVFSFLCVLFIALLGYYAYNLNVTTFNIKFNGIDISRMTKQGVVKKIDDALNRDIPESIDISVNEKVYSLNLKELDFGFDAEEISNKASDIYHSVLPFSDGAKAKKDLSQPIGFDSAKLDLKLTEIEMDAAIGVSDQTYKAEDGRLTVYEGVTGLSIDKEALKKTVIENLQNKSFDAIKPAIIKKDFQKLNLDDVRKKVKTDPRDARLVKEGTASVLKDEAKGVDFSISELQEKMKTPAKEYTVELKYTDPAITKASISESGFAYILSSSTTKFTNNSNRNTNIRLASGFMNGKVLNPGEIFSFNSTVGSTPASKGYKEATVYNSSGTSLGYGGGICQVSSTLYNACLLADFDIVARQNHSYTVTYLPLAQDAAISYPNQDFKFKNNYDFPVKILTRISGLELTVEIVATQPVNISVKLESVTIKTTKYSTTRKETSSLKSGKTKTEVSGHNGGVAELYKTVTRDGITGEKVLVNKSTYKVLNALVLVGTG